MTQYIIFEKQEMGWLDQTQIEARSAQAAISAWLGGLTNAEPGKYAAVPARSWKPVTVKVETKTALKFS